MTLEVALGYDAVKLFGERARRVKPGFQINETELAGILEICRLVEGLPLGIELAAAWVRVMACVDIAQEIREISTSWRARAP